MTEHVYPELTFSVDPEALSRFAAAVGADPGDGVPPTFATVYAVQHGVEQMLADTSLGVDPALMLHGEQTICWSRHPHAGEVLVSGARIASDTMRGLLRMVVVETTTRDTAGEAICVATSTMVVRPG